MPLILLLDHVRNVSLRQAFHPKSESQDLKDSLSFFLFSLLQHESSTMLSQTHKPEDRKSKGCIYVFATTFGGSPLVCLDSPLELLLIHVCAIISMFLHGDLTEERM
jgi:hypothetical protein